MKKSYQVFIGTAILVIGILMLGFDRIFVSAASASYLQSTTVLTTISVGTLLIGALLLFKTTLKKEK